jgi:predicted metal-binding membrane protein
MQTALAEPSPLIAMRTEPAIVVAVLAAAAVAWWSTAARMTNMDAGPGTGLGAVGWFAGVWAIMMAAMMLPSLAPTAALYAGLVRREISRVLLFTGGYLLVWSAAGLAAYGIFELGESLFAGALGWESGGRWLAAGVLAVAALYQLTPLKRDFLASCRNPLRSVRETSQERRSGAVIAGLRNGRSCLGCSWALMAALFALGVMSLAWMGLIAGLVALEKIGPWRREVRIASAGVLAVLAVALLAVPHDVPALVVPGTSPAAHAMNTMG